jgi:glycosyltransferase involved in cell wall biosynthesis
MGILQSCRVGKNLWCFMGIVNGLRRIDSQRILHLCSDYAKQKLYAELFSHLALKGLKQYVYVPVRSAGEIDKNRILEGANIEFQYSNILKKYHRLLFRSKIQTIFRDVNKYTDISKYSLVHAHFLYSDGAVARAINKSTGVPYIVTIRNTDVNAFMRWRKDLSWICWDIIQNASKIIFLSPAYRRLVLKMVPADIVLKIEKCSAVIPNGIDDFWLQEPELTEQAPDSPLRLLYVGDFSKNKNILNTVKAARIVNERLPITLTLVGGGGSDADSIAKSLLRPEWSFVTVVNRIENRIALLKTYRCHDIFVMPSFFETFGLSYIEALSQGLPIIHSKGQGVDGYFLENDISQAVDPNNPAAIADSILMLAMRLPDLRRKCLQVVKPFAWDEITRSYIEIYRDMSKFTVNP